MTDLLRITIEWQEHAARCAAHAHEAARNDGYYPRVLQAQFEAAHAAGAAQELLTRLCSHQSGAEAQVVTIPQRPAIEPELVRFEVGRTYSCRSICDHDCIFAFTVTARTEKTVTIKGGGKEVRRKVRIRDGVENLDPHGRYSMSPVLRADKVA